MCYIVQPKDWDLSAFALVEIKIDGSYCTDSKDAAATIMTLEPGKYLFYAPIPCFNPTH